MSAFACEFAVCVWTIAVSGKKKLRIQKISGYVWKGPYWLSGRAGRESTRHLVMAHGLDRVPNIFLPAWPNSVKKHFIIWPPRFSLFFILFFFFSGDFLNSFAIKSVLGRKCHLINCLFIPLQGLVVQRVNSALHPINHCVIKINWIFQWTFSRG